MTRKVKQIRIVFEGGEIIELNDWQIRSLEQMADTIDMLQRAKNAVKSLSWLLKEE